PFSFAYHWPRLSFVMLPYATFIATGAGLAVAVAAAVGALDAGAGATPPPQDRMTSVAATSAAKIERVITHLPRGAALAVSPLHAFANDRVHQRGHPLLPHVGRGARDRRAGLIRIGDRALGVPAHAAPHRGQVGRGCLGP